MLAYPLLTLNTTTDAEGLASMLPFTPLPNLPVLIGAALDHQWLVLDALNNLLGLSSPDAVKLTIGQ